MLQPPLRSVRAVVLAVLVALAWPAIALAADPRVKITVADPCVAGDCGVSVEYDGGGAVAPVLVEVSWGEAVASGEFATDASTSCGLPAGVPVDDLYGVLPEDLFPCFVGSTALQTPGERHVQVRVTDVATGAATLTDQVVAVAAEPLVSRPPRVPGGVPTVPGRDPGGSSGSRGDDACAPRRAGEQCGPGYGRRTAGGADKVSHRGWPAVTGILWKVLDGAGHTRTGGKANDELLGHHGSDVLDGGPGADILWGDWDPANNNGRQRDVLRGGAGNDFLYPSHGSSRVFGGAGNDRVWAFYGRGTIDCGPGRDTVRVRRNGAFKLHGCERVLHF